MLPLLLLVVIAIWLLLLVIDIVIDIIADAAILLLPLLLLRHCWLALIIAWSLVGYCQTLHCRRWPLLLPLLFAIIVIVIGVIDIIVIDITLYCHYAITLLRC